MGRLELILFIFSSFVSSFLSVLNYKCSESWTVETADVNAEIDWSLSVAGVLAIIYSLFFLNDGCAMCKRIHIN